MIKLNFSHPNSVSIQLVSPASGELEPIPISGAAKRFLVSIQLVSPASGELADITTATMM